MFIFVDVELFRFIGEQIGFEVLVFGPAGTDIEPGRCTFSVFWFSEFSFSSWISCFQSVEIFPPFLRNSCDEIIWWFWVTIVTVIFTCRYFKLSSNTSTLSQSNGRNFSGSSIRGILQLAELAFLLRFSLNSYIWWLDLPRSNTFALFQSVLAPKIVNGIKLLFLDSWKK